MLVERKDTERRKLKFDRGTLLLSGGDNVTIPPELSEHFVWDDRVNAMRGKALSYKDVRSFFGDEKCSDQVFKSNEVPGEWYEIELRAYQEAALVAWSGSERRGIVSLPTGAGKTRVAVAAIAETNVPTLCLVPTRVLLEQWAGVLQQFYKGPIGIIGDGQRRIEALTISTFESAYRGMMRFGDRFQMLVVDEVHHFGRGQRDETLVMSPAPFRLGLTATKPDEPGHLQRLESLVGPAAYDLGVRDLAGKFLADFQIFTISVHLNSVERLRYDREYKIFKVFFRGYMGRNPGADWQDFNRFAMKNEAGRNALSAFFRSRRIISLTESKRLSLSRILARHSHEKILVFTADTGAAYKVSREFLIPAITADIKRQERSRILSDFRDGKVRAIVACRVLNEGVDVPEASIAVILGGSANGREHVQRIGRLLRPSKNKKATIYELVANDTHEERHSKERGKPLAR